MDGKSLDVAQEKISRLKDIFPEAATDGKLDWDRLRQALGESLAVGQERYGLSWPGKSEVFRTILEPTTATLVPTREESIDFDATENVFIEGENLETLKVLQKAYFGKVKVIVIDEPYNTGNDSFVYPDNFAERKEAYLKRINEMDDQGYLNKDDLFRKNARESGHFHSNWLGMMYPRLYLARNLLREPEMRLQTLRDWLVQKDIFDIRKAQAFMDGLIELRNSHLEGLADSELEEEVVSGLKIASLITDIMRYLGIDLSGFVNGTLNSNSWINMFKHFGHWSHFSQLDYYDKVREEERLLLKETAAVMPTSLIAEILETRELDHLFRRQSPDTKFEQTWKEIKESLEIKISESLVKHFEEPNGLEQFWAIDYNAKGKRLLFDVKSHFHTNASCRGKLAEIATRAKHEAHVQVNYLTYFRMVCHGVSDRATSFSQSDCHELIKDNELVKMVWAAAVAQPLNPRMAGSLRQDRQKLIEAGMPEDTLDIPEWWKRLEEIGFFRS